MKPLLTNLIFGIGMMLLGPIALIRGWVYGKDGSIEEGLSVRLYGLTLFLLGFFLVWSYCTKLKKYKKSQRGKSYSMERTKKERPTFHAKDGPK